MKASSRQIVPIMLPSHTSRITYAISTSKSNQTRPINLLAQCIDIAARMPIAQGIAGMVFTDVAMPVNVYLFANQEEANKFQVGKPCVYLYNGSRSSVQNAAIDLPVYNIVTPQTYFLGLENPDKLQSFTASVDAIGYINMPEPTDAMGWTEGMKQKLTYYMDSTMRSYLTPEQEISTKKVFPQFINCGMHNMFTKYSPDMFTEGAARREILKKAFEPCKSIIAGY